MNNDSFSFTVYMIHELARAWKILPTAVYARLEESNCISDFLVKDYDVLHTMSTDTVVRDIEQYLQAREVSV